MKCKLSLTNKAVLCNELPGYGDSVRAVDIRLLGFRRAFNTVSTALLEKKLLKYRLEDWAVR